MIDNIDIITINDKNIRVNLLVKSIILVVFIFL